MDKDFTTEEVFNSAVSIVRNLPKEGSIKPSDELRLKLYAYFKQATHGPNDTSKPRFYQVVEGYKWDSWRKLGDMPKETAMMHYIQELKEIMKTIPVKETDVEDNKHFEDVLGKKFYDYCKSIVSCCHQDQPYHIVDYLIFSTKIYCCRCCCCLFNR